MSNRTLYPHQQRSLTLLRQSVSSGHRRPLLQLPTGGGKTVVASTITRGALVKGNSVIFTVPSKGLIDQTIQMFWQEGIRQVGVMQADHPLTNATMPVQVATVQTLQRREIPKASIVLVDECHIQFKFVRDWMQRPSWQSVPFIGLSATPWSKGLGQFYDDLIIGTTTEELISTVNPDTGRTFLSPFKVFAADHPDLEGVKTVAGDYHEGQLSERMQKPKLIADTVQTWLKLGRGRPTLVFAVDRAHAQALHESFCASGVDAEYVDAFTSREEREEVRKRTEAGKTEVVVNIGCLTTGCDWPFVSCIVLARPTKSPSLYVQIIGRGLRSHPGKDHCLVLDHSDSTQRLGFVTDIHRDGLCDGKPNAPGKAREKETPEPRECSSCSHLMPPSTRACPNCGHEIKRVSTVAYRKGELKELARSKKPAPATLDTKQLWWSAFIGYSQRNLKNHKWCLAQYKQKFGVWPRGVHDIGTEPPADVLSWIKSRNIAWAKGGKNAGMEARP